MVLVQVNKPISLFGIVSSGEQIWYFTPTHWGMYCTLIAMTANICNLTIKSDNAAIWLNHIDFYLRDIYNDIEEFNAPFRTTHHSLKEPL